MVLAVVTSFATRARARVYVSDSGQINNFYQRLSTMTCESGGLIHFDWRQQPMLTDFTEFDGGYFNNQSQMQLEVHAKVYALSNVKDWRGDRQLL